MDPLSPSATPWSIHTEDSENRQAIADGTGVLDRPPQWQTWHQIPATFAGNLLCLQMLHIILTSVKGKPTLNPFQAWQPYGSKIIFLRTLRVKHNAITTRNRTTEQQNGSVGEKHHIQILSLHYFIIPMPLNSVPVISTETARSLRGRH